MTRKQSELKECQRLSEVAAIVYESETAIDPMDKIYLMTVKPLRDTLPDCDFINQHIYFVGYIIDYLKGCESGAGCVESTQAGLPHYHLWYQTSSDPNKETWRIRWIKILQRIANVDISHQPVRYFRINRWYKSKNALYYYKEDAAGQQLYTPYNPVNSTTDPPDVDYADYNTFFTISKRHTSRAIVEKASQVRELEKFYSKSI